MIANFVDVPNTVEKTIDGNTTFQEDEQFIVQLTKASIIINEPGPLNDVTKEHVEFVDDEAEISYDPPYLSQNYKMKLKMKMWKFMIVIMKNNNKNSFVFNIVLCCFVDNLVHHYEL